MKFMAWMQKKKKIRKNRLPTLFIFLKIDFNAEIMTKQKEYGHYLHLKKGQLKDCNFKL